MDLVQAWRAGDEQAGRALFERHYGQVARFFGTKVGEQEAIDLVQSTFLACLEGRERLREAANFRRYLFTVAHNLLYRHYGKRARRQGVQMPAGDEQPSVADLSPSAPTVIAKREEQRLILRALREIPLDCQVVLELYYWERMTVGELAEVLEVPLGTAKTRLRRARARLEERLAQLAESSQILQSTLSDLEGWARGLRDKVRSAR